MKRVPIRDLRSPKEVKPRVFDALIEPERVLLDVKDSKKGNVIIPSTMCCSRLILQSSKCFPPRVNEIG